MASQRYYYGHEVDAMESALAAAQSRIAELEADAKRVAFATDAEFAGLRACNERNRERIAELERMVVWCVETGASFVPPRDLVYNELGFGSCVRVVITDGTPASILAAVEKAMGGVE